MGNKPGLLKGDADSYNSTWLLSDYTESIVTKRERHAQYNEYNPRSQTNASRSEKTISVIHVCVSACVYVWSM